MPSQPRNLRVLVVGAGLGGVAGSIAMAKAGCSVTLLEASPELGEIGAGIQMTPNVSRFLIKWGVDKVIGKNLVEFEELNLRKKDGTKIGYTRMIPYIRDQTGYPWWVVHRAHLHEGLVTIARESGVDIRVNSKVDKLECDEQQAKITTWDGKVHTADLVIGSDGVSSIVRNTLFPGTDPVCPTNNFAYRGVLPYSQIRKDPIAKDLSKKLTMDVWMADGRYIISYPISGGEVFNMVLAHHCDTPMEQWEEDALPTLKKTYADFDPMIAHVCQMVPQTKRWPLLVTGPLKTWLSPRRNVVLMGDAAHSMTNHMAQGAATAMEDGVWLARVLREVLEGRFTLAEALELYEKTRVPKVAEKQQVSFINGVLWQLPDGPEQEARDRSMQAELNGQPFIRSANLYGAPQAALSIYYYDAEEDAELAIKLHLTGREEPDPIGPGITKRIADRYLNWIKEDAETGKTIGVA